MSEAPHYSATRVLVDEVEVVRLADVRNGTKPCRFRFGWNWGLDP
jgi:hypothetical protein